MYFGLFVLEVFDQNILQRKLYMPLLMQGQELLKIPGTRLLVTVIKWDKEPLPHSPHRQ